MRSICSSVLSFDLVNIPVKIYSVASNKKEHLRWITKVGNPVEQRYVDSKTGAEVSREDIRLGYEIEKDKFILLSKEELDALSNDGIKLQFTSKFSVSHEMVEKAYYLGPDKSEASYNLLHHCLWQSGYVMVCQWYTKREDRLVVISATNRLLLMLQLHHEADLHQKPYQVPEASKLDRKEVSLCKAVLRRHDGRGAVLGHFSNGFSVRLRALAETKRPNLLARLQKSLTHKQ